MYSWDKAQVVLVGNKCDLSEDRQVVIERGKRLADQLGKNQLTNRVYRGACKIRMLKLSLWMSCMCPIHLMLSRFSRQSLSVPLLSLPAIPLTTTFPNYFTKSLQVVSNKTTSQDCTAGQFELLLLPCFRLAAPNLSFMREATWFGAWKWCFDQRSRSEDVLRPIR